MRKERRRETERDGRDMWRRSRQLKTRSAEESRGPCLKSFTGASGSYYSVACMGRIEWQQWEGKVTALWPRRYSHRSSPQPLINFFLHKKDGVSLALECTCECGCEVLVVGLVGGGARCPRKAFIIVTVYNTPIPMLPGSQHAQKQAVSTSTR